MYLIKASLQSPLKLQKKFKQRGWGYYNFLKTPLEFCFFLLYPWKSKQNKAQPSDISQTCVRTLLNSKSKSKDPWKFYITFSWSPLEILLSFWLTPGNCICHFFDTLGNPRNSISSPPPPPPSRLPPQPSVWIFSGITQD